MFWCRRSETVWQQTRGGGYLTIVRQFFSGLLQKYRLIPSNDNHICGVSCGATWQIWMRIFDHPEKWRKLMISGNWFSNPHPRSADSAISGLPPASHTSQLLPGKRAVTSHFRVGARSEVTSGLAGHRSRPAVHCSGGCRRSGASETRPSESSCTRQRATDTVMRRGCRLPPAQRRPDWSPARRIGGCGCLRASPPVRQPPSSRQRLAATT